MYSEENSVKTGSKIRAYCLNTWFSPRWGLTTPLKTGGGDEPPLSTLSTPVSGTPCFISIYQYMSCWVTLNDCIKSLVYIKCILEELNLYIFIGKLYNVFLYNIIRERVLYWLKSRIFVIFFAKIILIDLLAWSLVFVFL